LKIFITRYIVMMKKLDLIDIKCLAQKYLHIDYHSLKQTTDNDILTFKYVVDGKKIVTITTSANISNKDCDVLLDLKLEGLPNIDMHKLHKFVGRYSHKVIQLDISYIDDLHHLSTKVIKNWFKQDNSIGNLVKYCSPRYVRKAGKLHQVKLESKESTANYGYICMGSKSGSMEFNIRIKKKDKIEYILDQLDDTKQMESRCLKLLVSLIDFITSETKKTRIKSKYVRQPQYGLFLRQDVKPVNWSGMIGESV